MLKHNKTLTTMDLAGEREAGKRGTGGCRVGVLRWGGIWEGCTLMGSKEWEMGGNGESEGGGL